MKRSPPWNDAEIAAILRLYRSMWIYATAGVDYNKAQMIREASGKLDKFHTCNAPLMLRSRGSIEAKLMNVTAALESIDRADLSMNEYGYRPLSNMQAALKDAVVDWAKGYKPVEQQRRAS